MLSSRIVRFPDAEMSSCAIRRGPVCCGAGRGIGRGTGRACAVGDEAPPALKVAFTFGRLAGRLGAVGGAPVGRGCPLDPVIVSFTCGRFAGRLEASIAPAGFCGGAPLVLLAGRVVAGFATAGFATGFAAGLGAGFGVLFGFAAGLGAGFGAGLELPPRSLESSPFFSGMRRHVAHQIGNAAAVTPLVVVPGDDLHELVANHHRAEGVDNRRAGVALVVRRDERLI